MWLQMTYANYLFKYASDVLLIPYGTVGRILALARLWDGFTDVATGYLSDRTHTRAGRRRPWLLASALPIGVATFLVWNPPAGLSGAALILWMYVAVGIWETITAAYLVPYMALGAEVTMDHHDRTRVAAYRQIGAVVGHASVAGCLWLLAHSSAPRALALPMFGIGAAIAVALMLVGPLVVRERPEHLELRARHPLRSLLGVLRNPYLLWLVAIYFFDIVSFAALGQIAPFFTQYVVGNAGLFAILWLVLQVGSSVGTPLLARLSRRLGKPRVWAVGLALQALGYGATWWAGPGDGLWVIACIAVAGIGSAGSQVVGMSLFADAVDYDEYLSGERREGLHYAGITLSRKISVAALSLLLGLSLEGLDFRPNAEQSAEALRGLRALFAGLPVAACLVAIALVLPYGLTEREHARIRAATLARRATGS
jgi:sugar (glycoside-pentoside-hexuronide) transporter